MDSIVEVVPCEEVLDVIVDVPSELYFGGQFIDLQFYQEMEAQSRLFLPEHWAAHAAADVLWELETAEQNRRYRR